MIRSALAILALALFLTSSANAAVSEEVRRYAVEIQSEGGEGPDSGPTGTCGMYDGNDLQEGCEYGPGSFVDWSLESEDGPGDREGGMPDYDNASDGFDCDEIYSCG